MNSVERARKWRRAQITKGKIDDMLAAYAEEVQQAPTTGEGRCPDCLSASRVFGNMRPCQNRWHSGVDGLGTANSNVAGAVESPDSFILKTQAVTGEDIKLSPGAKKLRMFECPHGFMFPHQCVDCLKGELTALQAHCERLRNAGNELVHAIGAPVQFSTVFKKQKQLRAALAATPSVSLAEHDRDAIKQFCGQIIAKVRPYAQVTINGEHFVLEDWLRTQAGVTEKPDCLCVHAVPNFDGIHHDRRCKLYQGML